MWAQAASETALVLIVAVLFACAVVHAFVADTRK
jgi:hypothetical protein